MPYQLICAFWIWSQPKILHYCLSRHIKQGVSHEGQQVPNSAAAAKMTSADTDCELEEERKHNDQNDLFAPPIIPDTYSHIHTRICINEHL